MTGLSATAPAVLAGVVSICHLVAWPGMDPWSETMQSCEGPISIFLEFVMANQAGPVAY